MQPYIVFVQSHIEGIASYTTVVTANSMLDAWDQVQLKLIYDELDYTYYVVHAEPVEDIPDFVDDIPMEYWDIDSIQTWDADSDLPF